MFFFFFRCSRAPLLYSNLLDFYSARGSGALSSKEKKKERKLKKASEFEALAEKAEIELFVGQEPASKDERVQSERLRNFR